MLPINFGQGIQHVVECHVVERLTMPVILGMQWLKLHNPSVDWSNYVLTIASSTGGEVCLTGVRPHNLRPVVELCSAKVAARCGCVVCLHVIGARRKRCARKSVERCTKIGFSNAKQSAV